uniref:NAC domain-containing protein n=1 Tax=Oryza punctata TaxID=4537 RepID=A0A0E0LZF4_ORYPU
MADAAADACPAVFASRHPTEQELIASYLHPRLLLTATNPAAAATAAGFIHHADAYAADPADLTARHLPARAADGSRAWYFFSPVRTTTERGTRRARAVESGDGCWHSESGVRAVVDAAGRRVGHRQFFSFVKKREEDGKRVRTGWLMVELGLDNDASNPASSSNELVLCKIYMTPRMPPPSPPSAVTTSSTMELMPRMLPPSPPTTTMEMMPGGHKRKIPDEIAPAATTTTSSAPQQQRRQRYVPDNDGSKESSGESSVVILDDDDDDDDDDGCVRSKLSSDDGVMLPDAREDEQHAGTSDSIAGNPGGFVTGGHGKLLPDLNVVATVAPDHEDEEGRRARDAPRPQDGGTSTTTTMVAAAGERGSTTGGYLPAATGYRRTLMLFLEEDAAAAAVEDEQQQPPATRTEANLQLRQPPCCTFVVHPCTAHAKMRHGAAYGCGCRVTGSVRRGGYHLPTRVHTTTTNITGQ